MQKIPVIAAFMAGLAGFSGWGGAAHAQDSEPAPPQQPSQPEPAPTPAPGDDATALPPANSDAANAQPTEPRAAPKTPSPGGLDNSLFPNPGLDSDALKRQGEERPDAHRTDHAITLEDIFAEDWWSHARPILEFHGYFRTRSELFHNFALGRRDDPDFALWPQPADNQYTTISNNMNGTSIGPVLCKSDETDAPPTSNSPLRGCRNRTQAGANMRFRLNPELHVSDNLRVRAQIDMLDNLVLGSTPEGYALGPGPNGYQVLPRNGTNAMNGATAYLPNGYVDNSQVAPESGGNGLESSIRVKRAWAEYTTPFGEARFGRMPNHWGLGMLYNGGDGYDDDYQSTVDRLMIASGIKMLDLVIAGMWDFPNEGAVSIPPYPGAEVYDRAQLDDVRQYGLMVMRSKSPELTKLELSRGNLVLNTGLYLNYRSQLLADDRAGSTGANVPDVANSTIASQGFARRGLTMWVPDLWFQLLYKKLRVEFEGAAVLGSVESTSVTTNGSEFAAGQNQTDRRLRQYGFAFELTQKLVEDKLRLNFKSGWASGDADAFDPNTPGNLAPGAAETQVNDRTISTFRFNPAYRVDNILNRYILQRVQGAYYFNPSLDYDFTRDANGQRLGGGLNVVWTRASQFAQTPGHGNDLGLELGGSLYFQSKDGALNDNPSQMGGFYAMLSYAVLFPLDGLGYQAVPKQTLNLDTSAAQTLRLYLGVLF